MSGQGVVVLRDTATALLRDLRRALRLPGMAAVVGRAERGLFRDHLFALNTQRHKSGGRNYYTQAGRSLRVSTHGPAMTVSINQVGFRQRVEGGPIKPGPGKRYLTIAFPGMPGYGKRAAEFDDLEFGHAADPKSGRMRKALIRRPSTALRYRRRKQQDGTLKTYVRPGEVTVREPVFWLVRSVNQKADRSVLPSDRDVLGTAEAAIGKRLARLQTRGGAV